MTFPLSGTIQYHLNKKIPIVRVEPLTNYDRCRFTGSTSVVIPVNLNCTRRSIEHEKDKQAGNNAAGADS